MTRDQNICDRVSNLQMLVRVIDGIGKIFMHGHSNVQKEQFEHMVQKTKILLHSKTSPHFFSEQVVQD